MIQIYDKQKDKTPSYLKLISEDGIAKLCFVDKNGDVLPSGYILRIKESGIDLLCSLGNYGVNRDTQNRAIINES